jgi:hypothetical protein
MKRPLQEIDVSSLSGVSGGETFTQCTQREQSSNWERFKGAVSSIWGGDCESKHIAQIRGAAQPVPYRGRRPFQQRGRNLGVRDED